MKNLNLPLLSITTLTLGVLIIPSYIGAFAADEGTLSPDDTMMNFFAQLFNILRFPTHTLLWPVVIAGGPVTFFGGLILNCMFYGLLIERIIYGLLRFTAKHK